MAAMPTELQLHNVHKDPEAPARALSRSHSAFSSRDKKWIVVLVAFAAWFSTLSSFIYFPAIPALADSLHTSIERINMTVTSYLIVSGVAPSLVGNAADLTGRRPSLVIALSIYVVANIALAVQDSFWGLLFLRMVQSAGISGVIAPYVRCYVRALAIIFQPALTSF